MSFSSSLSITTNSFPVWHLKLLMSHRGDWVPLVLFFDNIKFQECVPRNWVRKESTVHGSSEAEPPSLSQAGLLGLLSKEALVIQ
jgi:hypothetical protein